MIYIWRFDALLVCISSSRRSGAGIIIAFRSRLYISFDFNIILFNEMSAITQPHRSHSAMDTILSQKVNDLLSYSANAMQCTACYHSPHAGHNFRCLPLIRYIFLLMNAPVLRAQHGHQRVERANTHILIQYRRFHNDSYLMDWLRYCSSIESILTGVTGRCRADIISFSDVPAHIKIKILISFAGFCWHRHTQNILGSYFKKFCQL